MDWLEAGILVGSFAGLVSIPTTLFVIYDRVVRGRPIFVLHVAGRIACENRLFLRMKNVLDEDIVAEDWQITPPLIGLSADDSFRAIAKAVVDPPPRSIVPPMGSLLLHLIILPAATGRDNDKVEISARWMRTRNPWPFQRRVKFPVTVARLKEWKEAHMGAAELTG